MTLAQEKLLVNPNTAFECRIATKLPEQQVGGSCRGTRV
jgi:hypothetical protein